MGKIYATSDIWFNRPYGKLSEMITNEYNDMIIENWNKTVGKRDVIYILGGLGIGELYPILSRLNGELHILNNFFTKDERYFINVLKDNMETCNNKKLKNKIIFEDVQILPLPQLDTFITYFPLSSWYGSTMGTYCFHGYTSESDMSNNSITCQMENWKFKPVLIEEVKENIGKFRLKI